MQCVLKKSRSDNHGVVARKIRGVWGVQAKSKKMKPKCGMKVKISKSKLVFFAMAIGEGMG